MSIVCFIHSCNSNERTIPILKHLMKAIVTSGLIYKLDHIFINNISKALPNEIFNDVDANIIINNTNMDDNSYECPTLIELHKWARKNPKSKILYLHTKGLSYDINHQYYRGVWDWINFMLYCLVMNHYKCLELLGYVDAIGTDYRDVIIEKWHLATHFSGNFWWANSKHISSLQTNGLKEKFDAEFWLLKNYDCPIINIHTCPYGHYEHPYTEEQYASTVTNKLHGHIHNVMNIANMKIYYGVSGHYKDVTGICHNRLIKNGIMRIPVGDNQRNEIFGDPIKGVVKHIRIGDVKYTFMDPCCFRILNV